MHKPLHLMNTDSIKNPFSFDKQITLTTVSPLCKGPLDLNRDMEGPPLNWLWYLRAPLDVDRDIEEPPWIWLWCLRAPETSPVILKGPHECDCGM